MWYVACFVAGLLLGLMIGAWFYEMWTLYRIWTES
jgi:hypothetical protein